MAKKPKYKPLPMFNYQYYTPQEKNKIDQQEQEKAKIEQVKIAKQKEESSKGWLDKGLDLVKSGWDTIERVDSGWKNAHAQSIKNMRQNVIEDYQERNKNRLKPEDYLRPTHSSTANEAFKHDETNTFTNFLDSLFDRRNVQAFKEGYREKDKTTGRDIAEMSLPNASQKTKDYYGYAVDIADSPASILPWLGLEKTAVAAVPRVAKVVSPASKIAEAAKFGKWIPETLGQRALVQGLTGLAHGTLRGVGEDKHGWDIPKTSLEDAATGIVLGEVGHGIGKGLEAVGKGVGKVANVFRNPKTGKVELVNDIPKDILQLPQSKIAGLLSEPKNTNFYADSSGTSYKTLNEFDSRPKAKDFISELLQLPGRQPKGLLPEGTKPNFYADELGNVANIGPFPRKGNAARNIEYNYDPYNKIRNLPAVVPQPKSGLPAVLEDLKIKKPTHFYAGQQGVSPNLFEYLKNVKTEGPKSLNTRPLPKSMEYDYRPNIEDRTLDFVKNKNIKPFSNEHPEIQPFIQEEAAYLLGDVMNAVKGQRHSFVDELGNRNWMGTKKFVSPTLDRIQLETGSGYNQVQKSLERIVNGEAKTPLDKQIELVLHDNLSKGYKTMEGVEVPPNQDYLKVKGTVDEKINMPKKMDQFLSRLDEMEGSIRERINSRKGRLNSNPFEDLTDYSALGAIKIAKGTVKYADWSASMIQEFGEEIKPHLQRIYDQAVKIHSTYTKEFKKAPTDPEMVANRARVSMDNIAVQKENLTKQIKRFTAIYHKTTEPGIKNAMQQKIGAAKAELQKLEGRLGKVQAKAAPPTEDSLLGDFNATNAKDKSGLYLYNTDIYRVLEEVLGPENAAKYLNPLDDAKKANAEFQQNLLKQLDDEVVKKLGITKDSDLSAAVQRYGEGGTRYFDAKTGQEVNNTYTIQDLQRDFPEDWQRIVEGDKWFRKSYDNLIDRVNEIQAQIYPNNPDKLIPKRPDYYRHIRELNGLSGVKNFFETPANISSNLQGISEFTNPKTKWASFKQKRGYGEYKEDAVGGFLDYLPSASYSIHIDPQISRFQSLIKDLQSRTEGTNNLEKTISFLTDYTNDLAGKTNFMDRPLQKFFGRKVMSGVKALDGRVKGNLILGKASSAISQLANIPAGIAHNKQFAIPGAVKSIRTLLNPKNTPLEQSGFLKERLLDRQYREFNTSWLDLSGGKFKDAAAWFLEEIDRIGTHFTWNGAYEKAVSQGIADPVRYADNVTRKLVGGRGIGEVPLTQKSTITQLVAPFTLEVANLWHVQRDMFKAKDITGLMTLYLANYVYNNVSEDVMGRRVTFDPVKATQDALGELNEGNYTKAGGRMLGEVLSNTPGGQFIGNVYPEKGNSILPPREEFFGTADPTKYSRYGTGVPAIDAWQNPVTSLVFPFGGKQVSQTLAADKILKEGGKYKPTGELKFPVANDDTNKFKGLLFGESAFRENKDYYDNKRSPLGSEQTEAYKQQVEKGKDPKQVYNFVLELRKLKDEQEKLKDSVGKGNPTTSQKTQNNQYEKRIKELDKILGLDKLRKEKDKNRKKW